MAYDGDFTNGVWRTIGGRKVFIRTGQSLSEAMIESGKFKNLRKDYKTAKEELKQIEEKETKDNKIKEMIKELGLGKDKEEDYKKDLAEYFKMQKDGTFQEQQDKLHEIMDKYNMKAYEVNQDKNALEVLEAKNMGEMRKDDLDMLSSIYAYSNENQNFKNDKYYQDLVDKYGEDIVGKKYKELEDKYEIVPNTSTDSEGLTYNSLKEREMSSSNRTYEQIDKEWQEQAKKMEKHYDEFGSNTVDDEIKLNKLSRERDIAQFKSDEAKYETAKEDQELKESAKKLSDTVKAYYKQAGVDVDKNIAKVNDRKLAKSIDPNFNSREDVEENLRWFEKMEEKYPTGKGLENNEEYQALKADYESVYKTKWNGATKTTNQDIGEQIKQSIKNAGLGKEAEKLKAREITTEQLNAYRKEKEKVQREIDDIWDKRGWLITAKIRGESYDEGKLKEYSKRLDELGVRKNELGSIINLHTINDSKPMNDKIREEAFKKYKKEHPGTKKTLQDFLKK